MARIALAPEVLDDFDRILAHLAAYAVPDAPARIMAIVQALDILQTSPLIGRPAQGGMWELIIGRGARGYVALYRFVPGLDTVFVLAIRSRRKAGFKRQPGQLPDLEAGEA
ncbi:MAG: type II toxin-antitoxin system RelE/ParE family toxin [Proteobacteria bacterium]|nr:type II toxin-antitoxin system RelE/ParE family toxin [Pseudomonadota bacterium]